MLISNLDALTTYASWLAAAKNLHCCQASPIFLVGSPSPPGQAFHQAGEWAAAPRTSCFPSDVGQWVACVGVPFTLSRPATASIYNKMLTTRMLNDACKGAVDTRELCKMCLPKSIRRSGVCRAAHASLSMPRDRQLPCGLVSRNPCRILNSKTRCASDDEKNLPAADSAACSKVEGGCPLTSSQKIYARVISTRCTTSTAPGDWPLRWPYNTTL